MRIACFTDTYLPQRDGVVTTILNMREEMAKKGHRTFIFATGTQKQKKENRDADVHYHSSLPFMPYPEYRIAVFPVRAAAMVREQKCDIIHTHGMAGMGMAAYLTARALDMPLVGSFHTLIPETMHYLSKSKVVKSMGKQLTWNYLKWYFNKCDIVTVPGEWVAELVRKHGIRNVRVVPLGIQPKKFAKAKGGGFRRAHGLGKAPVILYVGRIVEEKNIETLIRSAIYVLEEMPDAKFVIVGKGPAERKFAQMARQEGVAKAFVFTGFLPEDALPEAYAACDVLAFPSTFETLGLVALEAMACGKPVACADHGPLREIVVEGKTGAHFKPASPEACAEAIVRVYKARRRFARACKRTAAAHSAARCADAMLLAYKEAIAKKRKARKRGILGGLGLKQ